MVQRGNRTKETKLIARYSPVFRAWLLMQWCVGFISLTVYVLKSVFCRCFVVGGL